LPGGAAMRKNAFAFTSVALVLAVSWGVVLGSVWLPVDSRVLLPAAAVAVALTVLSGMGLMLRRLLRDRVALHLADTVVASRRAALTATLPLRAVRAR
jgi:hypothetical protein